MPSIELIENTIGRKLNDEERCRVLEREELRLQLHDLIDSGSFIKARSMLESLKLQWGRLHPELVYAESCIEWSDD